MDPAPPAVEVRGVTNTGLTNSRGGFIKGFLRVVRASSAQERREGGHQENAG